MAQTTRRRKQPEERRHLENWAEQEDIIRMQKTLSSCRPKRDYTRCVKWSGAINKEMYLLYITAQPKVKGYQQRLKHLWDDNCPEFNQLTSKHLAQQIRNIKTKKLVSEPDMQLIGQRVNRTIETQIGKTRPQKPEKEQEQKRSCTRGT